FGSLRCIPPQTWARASAGASRSAPWPQAAINRSRSRSMGGECEDATRTQIDQIYRAESRRVFATLVRLLGDFDLAEEALHEAFTAAVQQWPRDGLPNSPRAWLVTVGRLRGIDALRRRQRVDQKAS